MIIIYNKKQLRDIVLIIYNIIIRYYHITQALLIILIKISKPDTIFPYELKKLYGK